MDQLLQSFAPDVAHRIDAFRTILRRELPDAVDRLIVFGSQARGDAHDDSDIDVAVLVKAGLEDDPDVRGIVADAMFEDLDERRELNALTLPHDFLDPVDGHYRTELARRIGREGIEV